MNLEVHAEAPPGTGGIISVEWDFDGQGTFPIHHEIDPADTSVLLYTTHTYDEPGTYFVTARVCSHRDSDVGAEFRRLPNVASARVVVR